MAKTKKENKEVEDISELINFKLNWGYVIMAAIILLLVLGIFFGLKLSKKSSEFTYNGVVFNKTMENTIAFYTVKIPVTDSNGNLIGYRSIDFRNDPRNLANISFEKDSEIKFALNRTVFVTSPELTVCEDNNLAAANFGIFLSKYGYEASAGFMNESGAKTKRLDYVTCENRPHNTVIEVLNGNETIIRQTAKNCYQIIFNNCEILRAMEKFELQLTEEYFARINSA
jgi:hypothetical protein